MRKIIVGVIVIVVALFILTPLRIPLLPILFVLIGLVLVVLGAIQTSGTSSNTSTTDGFGSGFAYCFEAGNTGIALSTDRQIVKLRDKKNVKEYPFTDIRKWETNMASGGDIVYTGRSMSGAMAVIGENNRNKRRNIADSGFFVTVRDIDNPVWRVAMIDKKTQQRWMEIFAQCINEGPAAANP